MLANCVLMWGGVLAIFALLTTTATETNLVDQIKFDERFNEAHLVNFRITDCSSFPCIIKKRKEYRVDATFTISKDVEKPALKCATVYLGRQIVLPGYGGCDSFTNDTCPISANSFVASQAKFTIPWYVPGILYTMSCCFEDDAGQNMMCGQGSGRVV